MLARVIAAVCFCSLASGAQTHAKIVRSPLNPTQFSVQLSWTQSATPGVISNCVYRSIISGGPYTQLQCSSNPAISYLDSTVVEGNTYDYVTTAIVPENGVNVESPYSNEAQAVVPSPVAAPTNTTAVLNHSLSPK